MHAVPCRPLPSAVLSQFVHLSLGRHLPRPSPVCLGGIVGRFQFVLIVYCAIITLPVVLCQRVPCAIAPLVVVPAIVLLGSGLAPSVVVAVLLGTAGTDVARGPQGATGQTQVNILVVVWCGGHSATQDDVDNGIDVGNIDFTVMVDISSIVIAATQHHIDHCIHVGNVDLAITVHVARGAGTGYDDVSGTTSAALGDEIAIFVMLDIGTLGISDRTILERNVFTYSLDDTIDVSLYVVKRERA